MFLDDQLYEIGKQVDLNNFKSITKTINRMLNACIRRLKENSKNIKLSTDGSKVFKRVDNSWRLAVKKLKENGFDFVKEKGFSLFCLELYPEYSLYIDNHD